MERGVNTISDVEVMGEKAEMSHEELMHLSDLTPEEKVLEKKLRRRIDLLIMPLVILVYLMNYIDRYVEHVGQLQHLFRPSPAKYFKS
jgi:hypothetical protein